MCLLRCEVKERAVPVSQVVTTSEVLDELLGENMDSENVFIICGFSLLAVMTVTIGSCSAYESHLVRDMVRHGAHPIEAKCSVSLNERAAIVCGVLAAKKL